MYVIGQIKNIKRPNVGDGGEYEFIYVPDLRYGKFEKNIDAKRAFMEALEPELIGSSDEFIKLHFNAMSRNIKNIKIMKILD
jgi:hypothetical protein